MASSNSEARAGALPMKVETGVYATMRDGVRIALRIYRPDAEGEYPALFAASPYQYETDDLPHSSLFLWREVGPVQWYVGHGYCYVHADVRGTGNSEGSYGFLDRAEQQDYYELVEWIARQPWCSGKVGGIGQSYYAWSQWFMGIVNPPHLACIAPYDGAVDPYRGVTYHGGIYCEFLTWWYNMVRANNLHRAANFPAGREILPDHAWEFIRHQTYDNWWRERSPFERLGEIRVPVYSIGHWGKVGLHLSGNIVGYEEVSTPKKLYVTGARDVFEAHELFDTVAFHEDELKPFYDHYLKGIDTGWEKRPNVRLQVRQANRVRESRDWPLKDARSVSWYLHKGPSGSVTSLNDGALSTAVPKDVAGEAATTCYAYPDPKWKLGVVGVGPFGPDPVARVLTFTSAPLEEEVEIGGPIVLELYAESTATDTDFFVKLADQFPQPREERGAVRPPTAVNVSKGWLRASHREKDEARSSEWRPYYTHSNPQPIRPGRVYRYDIEVNPASYLFQKGHCIRLEIVNGDSPVTDAIFTHQYMYYKVGKDTFHHSKNCPSRLVLPVVPKGK
ncbi:MAG: hypothetical protein A3G25_21645 [Betaproteobacteria bacterium RIFCSPLOWO2_12_FULL_63_13]|nr:MAG: hypothetical protein A3H32_17640 [Betaproteobacteria bacterium RIFCSPLOWO2_02_FULL_63_19]OGA42541.1 MAG: hypothetical protein A3G25_21645 [Betaproteobacteria bacterium RIFCSPLOWO2_12_FULL_63_13]